MFRPNRLRKEALAIICRLVNSCWFVFKWSIVAMLVTVVAVGGYLYLRLDDEVRRYAEGVLAGHYDHLDVKVGSARFEPGRGVMLRDVVIADRGAQQAFAEVDELQLLGALDIEALTSGQPLVRRIRIVAPQVRATRDAQGQWNLAQLFPPPTMGKHPADIEVVKAIVLVSDPQQGITKPIVLREVGMTASCVGQALATDPAEPPQRTYEVKASVGGDLADTFELAGTLNTGTGAAQAKLELVGFNLASGAVKSVLGRLPQLEKIAELSGRADVVATMSTAAGGRPTWNADFHVSDARVIVDGVPTPISHIAAEGVATPNRLFVRQAHAQLGKSRISLAVDRRGWTDAAPLGLQARAERFVIDDGLAELLPAAALKAWHRFRPAGEVTATLALQYDGRTWTPDLTVACHDVSFVDNEKFRHRLTSGTGTLRLGDRGDGRGPVLDIQNLKGSMGSRQAIINGSFAGLPGLGARRALGGEVLPPTGWLEITGNDFAITDQLVDAMQPKVRRIVDSLDAKGRFSFRWRYERNDPRTAPRTNTHLTFLNGRVQFEKFPYPLTHITGTAIEEDGHWRFEDLVSRDPKVPRVVRCHGTCNKLADDSHALDLTFVGEEVSLDDTLRLALPPAHQETWAAIRPRSGRINLTARVAHHVGFDARPRIHLEANPIPKTVSIEPTCFPYRLENLQGTIVADNNRVTLNRIRGEHGPTRFETDGSWIPNVQGGWTLQFDNLHVDRLAADYDLKQAVPTAMGKVIEYLKPAGTFSIYNGTVRFSRDVPGSTHLRSEWRVSLGCQQNDLELGVSLKSVSGAVHLAGRHEGNLRFTAGQLDLDSVFWNGMQLTNVRGPLWVDTQECRLGREATRRINLNNGKPGELKRIEADLYGGNLELDAGVQLSAGSRYVVDLAVDKCDLERMSTDYFGGSVDLSGSLSGQATLNGTGKSLELLEGGGRMAIRDAQMYELPVMARLLKVLRNRVPDKTAFNGVDALFKVDGTTIRFDELNLLGDAVSLYGKGIATFDRQLDLVFHSTVGRNDFNVPILRSMIGQASANLLLIKVTGPAENAEVIREPLPAVNELVEQLGGDGVATPRPERGFWQR